MKTKTLALTALVTSLISVAQVKSRTRATAKQTAIITPTMLRGKIVYLPISRPKTVHQLWCVAPDGTGGRPFWSVPVRAFASIDQIAVSPDASRVAFIGTAPGDDLYKGNSLWVSSLNGQFRRVLGGAPYPMLGGLSWSPDGKSLLCSSATGAHGGGPMTMYANIWIINADGSEGHSIGGSNYLANARWSRNGQRIAYDFSAGGISESPDDTPAPPERRSSNVDGSDEHVLVNKELEFQRERSSPDGKLRVSAKNSILQLLNVNGAEPRQLALGWGISAIDARFTADGKAIVFVADLGTRFQGMRINPDGTGLRRLGATPTAGWFVQWL